jgi:hypothetical protein
MVLKRMKIVQALPKSFEVGETEKDPVPRGRKTGERQAKEQTREQVVVEKQRRSAGSLPWKRHIIRAHASYDGATAAWITANRSVSFAPSQSLSSLAPLTSSAMLLGASSARFLKS